MLRGYAVPPCPCFPSSNIQTFRKFYGGWRWHIAVQFNVAYVHRDRKDYLGRGVQDRHLDFDTALPIEPT